MQSVDNTHIDKRNIKGTQTGGLKIMSGRRSNNYYDRFIKPNLENIRHWITEGYSHEQITKMLGIGKTTFYKYQNPKTKDFKKEFYDIVTAGTNQLGIKLEQALYKEAMGYMYEEYTEEVTDNHFGNSVKKKRTMKYARANPGLLTFALCNKFPEKWKRVDKEVIEAIESGKVNLDITDRHIKDAFKSLYPAMDDKEIKEKTKASKIKDDE